MISVQSALLVALGFLVASLLGLVLGSALWARAVRLTTTRIKQAMPVSEAEIRADRDRMRAEFAMRVHRLEASLEQAKLERARQFIEINRRDAQIGELSNTLAEVKGVLEEHANARRVLEQTVADRLPRVEARLAEAKRLLFNRDREIADLTNGAQRHKLALEEASSLTAQQTAQIQQLTSALSTRTREIRFEGELALRTELETLRAKTREQGTLIERLQQRLGQGYGAEKPEQAEDAAAAREIERLRKRLGEVEGDLASVRQASSDTDAARIAFESEIRGLTARLEDQSGEVARLEAALATYGRFEGKQAPVRESKIMLKARLSSAQAHSDQQAATIGRLRAELAATHERLSRQADHFIEEMRRVTQASQNAFPGPGQQRRRAARPEASLVERVAQVQPVTETSQRSEAVQEMAREIKRAQALAESKATAPAAQVPQPETRPDTEAQSADSPRVVQASPTATWRTPERAATGETTAPPAAELPQAPSILEERRRPRLLDRLAGTAKSQQG